MKKNSIVCFVTLIIAILIEAISWMISPGITQVSVPEDANNLYPELQYYISGYEVTGNFYTPINGDPQIGFILPDRNIKSIIFEFAEPVKEDIAVQVYYASNGESLTEDKKVSTVIYSGSNMSAVELEQTTYTHIRLDINGAFSLERVSTSEVPTVVVAVKPQPQYALVFIRWGIFFLLFSFTSRFYTFIQNKAHSRASNFLLGEQYVFLQKHKIVFFAVVMCFCVLVQANNSSMNCYNLIMPNNVAAVDMFTIGEARSIRSDEFLVETAKFFHNSIAGNLKSLWINCDNIIMGIDNVIKMLNPYYWGRLYLPSAYAFSWEFVMSFAISLFAFYRLFKIITGSSKFSVIASCLLVFSPGVQWWWGPREYGVLCGFIIFFHDFFECKEVWKKKLYCLGIVCLTSIIIPIIYPAWDIPLMYLYVFILIGIYAGKKRINFRKQDIPYIGITCAMMAIIVISYFLEQGEVTEVILSTVYPGKRFSAGGNLVSRYWADYLVAPLTPWKSFAVPGTNQSEISSFLHLFPIPLIVFALKYKDLKSNKVMTSLVTFNILCIVYMVFGVGNTVAKYTFLSYTTPERLFTIFGFASFMLLLFECYYIVPNIQREWKKRDIIKITFFNTSIIVFLVWVGIRQEGLVSYMGSYFGYAVVGLIFLGNMFYFGMKKAFITIMCILTVISGVAVNPINFGADVITDTSVAKAIREIDAQDSGRWIALGNGVLPKYVYAQGVDCLNWLNWPPRFDLFEPLDKNKEFFDIYNRYAHVSLSLNHTENVFVLSQLDSFSLNLKIDDLQIWDVKYVVTQGYLSENANTNEVKFEIIYHDTLDNINIYQVHYSSTT